MNKITSLLPPSMGEFRYSTRDNIPLRGQEDHKDQCMKTRQETKQRMSRIVKHNGTIYLCGQVCADASQGIKEQTATMLDKVEKLLEQAGSDKEHMLSATIYIKDMKDFAEMNEVWDNWVPAGHAPARACVEASMAREALLVEISVIAAEK